MSAVVVWYAAGCATGLLAGAVAVAVVFGRALQPGTGMSQRA